MKDLIYPIKIVFNSDNKSDYKTALYTTLNSIAGATVTENGNIFTVEFATPVESFTFTATGGQIRLNSITVSTAASCEHKSTTTTITDATCTTEGSKITTCDDCNEELSNEVLKTIPHDFNNGACSVCGAKDHEHTYNEEVTAPTCTTSGYTTYTCTFEGCNESYKDNEVEAKGHAYSDGVCANGCGIYDPDYRYTMSIADALKAPEGMKVLLTGTISEIKSGWNAQYGNMEAWLSDGEGNKILLYRIATLVYEGDEVSVEGVIGVYSNVNQIAKDGSKVVVTKKHDCVAGAEATCTDDQKCTICEAVIAKALGHTTDSGVCGNCGEEIGGTEGGDVEFTAALTFDNTSKRTEYSTSKQVWTENGITVTNNKSSSTSNVGNYSNPARFYAGSNLIIEVAEGEITEIVFDCNSSSHATALKNSIGTVSGATVSVSSDKVTVKFTEPLTGNFTIAKLTAQVRMDSITVKGNK